ncbi:MAG TPA: HAD family phosphatase [Spirochaetota bacterium]|nr:HAD family phosphatase [Spirochaetota bacterium]
MSAFRSILFDMDGVIVDSMRQHAECWIRVFREHGLTLSTEDIYLREGMSGIGSIIDIFRSKGQAIPSPDEMKSLQERKLELFERHPVHVYPEVNGILEFLSMKGVVLGLVTGSLRRSVNYVLPGSIQERFASIVTVDDIQNGKPHPEPYLKALEEVGFRPEEVLVIENAPLGIASAKSAGLRCFALTTTLDAERLANADRVFSSHKELDSCFKDEF